MKGRSHRVSGLVWRHKESSSSLLFSSSPSFTSSLLRDTRRSYAFVNGANYSLDTKRSSFFAPKNGSINSSPISSQSFNLICTRGVMLPINEIRKGQFIRYQNKIYEVMRRDQPRGYGRGAMNVSFEVKDIQTGAKKEEKVKSGFQVELLDMTIRISQFDRIEGKKAFLFDTEAKTEYSIPVDKLGDKAVWLNKGSRLVVKETDGTVLTIGMPTKVKHVIEQTEAVTGSQSAKMGYKNAKLKNGRTVKIPYYIPTGDTVWVSLETFEYLSKAEETDKENEEDEDEEDEEEEEEEEGEEREEEDNKKGKKKN